MNHIKINWENVGTNYNTHIKIIALFSNFEIAKLTVNSYESIIVDKKYLRKLRNARILPSFFSIQYCNKREATTLALRSCVEQPTKVHAILKSGESIWAECLQ